MLTGSRYKVARSKAGSGESIPTVVLPAELKNGACAIDRWLKANPPGGGRRGAAADDQELGWRLPGVPGLQPEGRGGHRPGSDRPEVVRPNLFRRSDTLAFWHSGILAFWHSGILTPPCSSQNISLLFAGGVSSPGCQLTCQPVIRGRPGRWPVPASTRRARTGQAARWLGWTRRPAGRAASTPTSSASSWLSARRPMPRRTPSRPAAGSARRRRAATGSTWRGA
eukprot:SAG22_NODE_253_length_13622_cov_15.026471_8_plen_225_part_00